MIVIAVTCYFLLFALLVSLIAFASARSAAIRFGTRATSALGIAARRLPASLLSRPARKVIAWFAQTVHRAQVHRGRLLLIGAVLCAPSLAVLILHARPVFDFSDTAAAPDRHITALLAGERLAAPPALAPEIFTTREVELVRPATAWVSRDWALLDDGFRQRLLTVFKLMRERYGYEMVLLEGYRSAERQAALAAMGPQVTRAKPGMSYHQYGLAADSAFLRDGRLVISEQDPWAMRGYELYGALAETAGLTWGGQWHMRDLGHVELRRPGVLARARANAPTDAD